MSSLATRNRAMDLIDMDEFNNVKSVFLGTRDPILEDFNDRFKKALRCFKSEKARLVTLARELCELSRSMIFQVWPVTEYSAEQVNQVITLFSDAAASIRSHCADELSKSFAQNIEDRAQQLQKKLRGR